MGQVRFLHAIGIREEVIGQVIVEFPALLSYSLDRKIRPMVSSTPHLLGLYAFL